MTQRYENFYHGKIGVELIQLKKLFIYSNL